MHSIRNSCDPSGCLVGVVGRVMLHRALHVIVEVTHGSAAVGVGMNEGIQGWCEVGKCESECAGCNTTGLRWEQTILDEASLCDTSQVRVLHS